MSSIYDLTNTNRTIVTYRAPLSSFDGKSRKPCFKSIYSAELSSNLGYLEDDDKKYKTITGKKRDLISGFSEKICHSSSLVNGYLLSAPISVNLTEEDNYLPLRLGENSRWFKFKTLPEWLNLYNSINLTGVSFPAGGIKYRETTSTPYTGFSGTWIDGTLTFNIQEQYINDRIGTVSTLALNCSNLKNWSFELGDNNVTINSQNTGDLLEGFFYYNTTENYIGFNDGKKHGFVIVAEDLREYETGRYSFIRNDTQYYTNPENSGQIDIISYDPSVSPAFILYPALTSIVVEDSYSYTVGVNCSTNYINKMRTGTIDTNTTLTFRDISDINITKKVPVTFIGLGIILKSYENEYPYYVLSLGGIEAYSLLKSHYTTTATRCNSWIPRGIPVYYSSLDEFKAANILQSVNIYSDSYLTDDINNYGAAYLTDYDSTTDKYFNISNPNNLITTIEGD